MNCELRMDGFPSKIKNLLREDCKRLLSRQKQQLSPPHPMTIFLNALWYHLEISCQTHSSLSLWHSRSSARSLLFQYLGFLPRKWNPRQHHQHHQLFTPSILSFFFQSHSHQLDEKMEYRLYTQNLPSPSENFKTSRDVDSRFLFIAPFICRWITRSRPGLEILSKYPITSWICAPPRENPVSCFSKHATSGLRRESPCSGNAQGFRFLLWLLSHPAVAASRRIEG